LYDELSTFKNLLFTTQLYDTPRSQRKARVEELLKTFGLYERKENIVDFNIEKPVDLNGVCI